MWLERSLNGREREAEPTEVTAFVRTEAAVDRNLAELERLLAADAIVSHFQPIVDLDTHDIVAFEALARGPFDSPLAMPGDLFGTAARNGRMVELDWACRAAAFRGAAEHGLTRPTTVFVNVEPVAVAQRVPDQYAAAIRASGDHLRIVFELTERALTERPSEVLRAVHHLRALGASIALDDVGVDHRSLALMPFVRPEVIKLDMSLVQGRLSPEKARTMHAVNAYAEESGAVILAEGIENDVHLARALALGSHFGQGWYFGRPVPTPSRPASAAAIPALSTVAGAPATGETPFDRILDAGARSRTATKRLLHALSQELEVHAATLGREAVVLAGLQHLRHFTPATRARYVSLASRAAFVGVLGTDLGAAPEPGVRGGCLDADDPLTLEWSVIVISPHFAAALVARDLGDAPEPDAERRFSYRLTYDRRRVVSAARLMMDRIAPVQADAVATQLRAA